MTGRIGRGGRKGQTHTATPKLRSYSVPPASEVTVTRTDGSMQILPAQKPQATQKQRPRKGPLICAMCGDPTAESPTVYSKAPRTRGKPVHASCDPTATQKRAKRPPRQRKQDLVPPPTRVRLTPGADPATAWIDLPCTQCPAQPGERCVVKYRDGSTAEVRTPHRERSLAARKAAAPR
ncbi:hypothetical protein ABZ851_32785 [Streptomyces sp. NPDC047049]|uniref:zinc finger domain-containing protein n=1 Tax=Streptomyces sp. NPDC047049 TaxID=3156688 RepID=UPI003401C987